MTLVDSRLSLLDVLASPKGPKGAKKGPKGAQRKRDNNKTEILKKLRQIPILLKSLSIPFWIRTKITNLEECRSTLKLKEL